MTHLRILILLGLSSASLIAADRYLELRDRVKLGDFSIDFRELRLACLKSEQCDSRGSDEQQKTLNEAVRAKDARKVAIAAEQLIESGFVNIQAHMSCARAYTELGGTDKAEFHRKAAKALLDSIFGSGDGKSQKTAFVVISTREEYLAMAVMGLNPFGRQSLIHADGHSYDRQEVEHAKTGEKVILFFNIDAFYGK